MPPKTDRPKQAVKAERKVPLPMDLSVYARFRPDGYEVSGVGIDPIAAVAMFLAANGPEDMTVAQAHSAAFYAHGQTPPPNEAHDLKCLARDTPVWNETMESKSRRQILGVLVLCVKENAGNHPRITIQDWS